MADQSDPQKPCTALVKYDPRAFQWLRVAYFAVNGHCFRREAGWLCPCGMRMPRTGILGRQLPECTALTD